jgi:FkbM family methyltransferase
MLVNHFEYFKFYLYTYLFNRLSKIKPKNYHELNFYHSNNIKFNELYSSKSKNYKLLYNKNCQKNISIRTNSSDYLVYSQIFLLEEYKSLINLIKIKNKNQIKTILDLGSNIGLASLYFSSHFPGANVYSVELDKENFEVLNLNLNGYEFKTFNLAISQNDGFVYQNRNFRDRKEWSISVSTDSDCGSKVISYSLGTFIKNILIDQIDILKIDVEGSEKDIFSSNEIDKILCITKFIAIEIHDEFDCRQMICDKLSINNFYWTNSGELTIGYNKGLL